MLVIYCISGQWAIKCTVVTLWSIAAPTSSRSPKGSQKVTALPCISTPHCSPTSQLLQSDLQQEKKRDVKSSLGQHTCFRQQPHPRIQEEEEEAPTRCWSQALPGGWSQSRHAARRVSHGAPLNKHMHHMLMVNRTCIMS